jgi:hypothetical protein
VEVQVPAGKQAWDERSAGGLRRGLMLQLLRSMARQRPAVVLIDDASNLDAESWATVANALINGVCVCVCVCVCMSVCLCVF